MTKNISDYPVWTAVVTPMNLDGSVDYESLENILKHQQAADNALTILGSTGEALNIDLDERKSVIEFAVGLNLDVPIMCGVGGINLHEQTDWIEYLNTLEIDAYLLVVPLYAKPGVHGQFGWFKHLMDISKRPCMLYNVPGRTAMKLEYVTVRMLKDHKNFWAIKEASGSAEEFKKYIEAAPNAQMMSGDDAMLPVFARLGAKGVVSVASNVWPKATHKYAEQCIAGDFIDYELWERAIGALFSASNPIPVKALLFEQGKIRTNIMRLPLSSEDLSSPDDLIAADKEIGNWL